MFKEKLANIVPIPTVILIHCSCSKLFAFWGLCKQLFHAGSSLLVSSCLWHLHTATSFGIQFILINSLSLVRNILLILTPAFLIGPTEFCHRVPLWGSNLSSVCCRVPFPPRLCRWWVPLMAFYQQEIVDQLEYLSQAIRIIYWALVRCHILC